MRKRRLFWRLFPSFLLISSLPLGAYFLLGRHQFYKLPALSAAWDKEEVIEPFITNLAWIAFWMTVAMGLLSWYLSRKVAKPLEKLESLTQEIIDSKEAKVIEVQDFEIEELAHIAELIGKLNSHLNNRVLKVTTQKNEQEALFSSLSEGVVAISSDLQIKRMNPAAQKLFGIESRFAKGMGVAEVIPDPQLRNFITQAMSSKLPMEFELEVSLEKIKNIQVNSAPYLNARSEKLGIVLVFSDITRMKQLERHRKEFVANVSHELKTPLTSIQGYAETLLNPKLEDVPDKRREFAAKIRDNSLRLKDIIEDLLYLSQLDRGSENSSFALEERDLSQMIQQGLQGIKPKAKSLGIDLHLELASDLKVFVNDGLFRQVVVNLVDNAIKYSDESKKVDIRAYEDTSGQIFFEVEDYGFGIPEEDHERLFERFYRVDKGRARDSGGSGLGLAIVKNILNLHQVEIELKSQLKKGSLFRLRFPQSGR